MEAEGADHSEAAWAATSRTGATVFVSANKIEFSRLQRNRRGFGGNGSGGGVGVGGVAWAVMGLLALVGFRVM